MPQSDATTMQFVVPSDVRFFRAVRLAIGGLATLAGFDVEAIDDLRIGIDELCGALFEAGDGSPLKISVSVDVGSSIRIEGESPAGSSEVDAGRFAFSQQILSVVADDFGVDLGDGVVAGWMVRSVADWQADADVL